MASRPPEAFYYDPFLPYTVYSVYYTPINLLPKVIAFWAQEQGLEIRDKIEETKQLQVKSCSSITTMSICADENTFNIIFVLPKVIKTNNVK